MTSSPAPPIEAREISLPKSIHTPIPQISSILYDPLSQSLALRHSDSSFSLYTSFSLLSTLPPTPHTLVPAPTSSAAFLHLRTSSATSATTLFLASAPLLRPPSTLLRFYILKPNRFAKIGVVSSHRDLEFDKGKGGVVFKANHGVSMRLSGGGTNVFSLYSVSESKIWVFGVRLVVEEEEGWESLKLIKCAVIDCCFRVFEIKVLFGFLVLGEENGVRFFPLKPLVKGRKEDKKNGGGGSRKVLSSQDVNSGAKSSGSGGDLSSASVKGEKGEKSADSSKLRLQKLRQDSKETGAFFAAFEDGESSSTIEFPVKSVKAISIQALSANKFVILDSAGKLHLLCLSYSVQGLCSPCPMQRLTRSMKVVKLSVFHDVSTVTQTVWISDGGHTVHLLRITDLDPPFDKSENKDIVEKLTQSSVTHAVFVSEKIKDIVPLAAESMMILGHGSLLAYTVPSTA